MPNMNSHNPNRARAVRPSRGWCRTLATITAAIAAGLVSASAQSITPVWEYLVNQLPSPIPVFTNTVDATDLDTGNGQALMDTIGPLRRYDATRLVLGIRENGINETVAHNTNLATAYPDRSLIWINPTNGQPMGVALTVGLFPVPLTEEMVTNGATPGQFYWSFDVSSDGYVYTGYKNQIIRYAPSGGGISPTPTVVYTLDGNTATNGGGVTPGAWTTFRWQHVRVQGAGTNTIVFAGGGGGRAAWMLTTTNGNDFETGLHMNGGFGNAAGGISHLIQSRDTPGDYWFFGGSFPNNSSGSDTKLYRAAGTPPFTWPNTFFNSPGWDQAVLNDPNTNGLTRYTANFTSSTDAHDDLDFVVNYSAPAFNHNASGGYKPGWLALHNVTNGAFIAAHELCVTEADEQLSTAGLAIFSACIGAVSISPLPDGTAEVLWSGGIYGYGRYIVGSPRYTTSMAMSKNIKLLWEQLQGQPNSLPIIDTDVESVPPKNGSSTMHVFTGFKKYDATRLLLAIRDNGINETVLHNTNLALAYPDRSLQWIDAVTGNPLGTALIVNYAPTPISDDNALYMAFGVSEDGVLYVGVADKILRYAPSGGGFAAPTVAYTLPGTDPQPTKTQFAEFRVSGSGASTVMVVASRNWWGSSDRILTTTDGLTYTETETVPTQGGISSVVPDPFGTGDNVLFKTLYPATSNGIDSTMNRRRQAGGTGSFFGDSFPVQQVAGSTITNSSDVIYRTYFLTDVQALAGQDWVLTYSTPSFRTFNNATVQSALKGSSPDAMPYQPGWLAIHDQATGEVRGLRKLNVTEALNVIPSTTGAPEDFTTGWFSYAIPQGGVELYPVLNDNSELAGVEILWWSATYGFGRYYLDTPPTSPTSGFTINVDNGKIRLDWTGIGQVYAASDAAGPFTPLTGACEGPYYLNLMQSQQFFQLRVK